MNNPNQKDYVEKPPPSMYQVVASPAVTEQRENRVLNPGRVISHRLSPHYSHEQVEQA